MNNEVYFKNDSWCICVRIVNPYMKKIFYEVKKGYRTEKEALKAKEDYDTQYLKDIENAKKRTGMRFTFKEYMEYWVKEEFIKISSKGSHAIAYWTIYKIIIPNLKQDMFLPYVTADYINELIDACKPVCDSAGQAVSRFLRNILGSAYSYGYMPKDIRDDLIPVKRRNPSIKILSYPELELLIQETMKHTAYRFEVLLALFCGLRSGEIRALRYEDFNKEEQTLRIERQFTYAYQIADANDSYEFKCKPEEKAPKANSYRLLKIPAFLFDELEKKKKFNEEIIKGKKEQGVTDLDEEYVCISCYGKRKGKSTLTASLNRLCHFSGIPTVSMHVLRHQFATMLLEEGTLSLEYIAKLMGHKSPMTTYSIYCDVMEAREQAKEALDTLIPYSNNREV